MGILEREKTEEILEVLMAENVPKLMTYTKAHTWEAQRTASRINTEKKKKKGISYSKYRKPKDKETKRKSSKKPENKYTLPIEGKALITPINSLSSISFLVNF